MLLIMSVFGDLNFSSLLCYLDDLLVFDYSEEETLKRLDVVLSRLRANNLKLAQKKCHFLSRFVRFLGHMVDSCGVSVDQEKVNVITAFREWKVKSFLGMVLYFCTLSFSPSLLPLMVWGLSCVMCQMMEKEPDQLHLQANP